MTGSRALVALAAALALAGAWILRAAPRSAGDALVDVSLYALAAELLLAAIALAASLLGRAGPARRLGVCVGPSRLGAGGLAWLVVGTLGLSHALDGLLQASDLARHSVLGEFPQLVAGARGARLALALLALGLAPALAEELLCRGLIQRALVRRFGPATGVTGAALVFGALHIEPIHGAFALALGLYLGLAAHWAGNSWAPIACHAANNALAVAAAAVFEIPTGGVSIALGLALAALGAWRAARSRRGAARPPDRPLQRRSGSDDR